MILTKVKLEDFISHRNTAIDLGYGINVIVGPNGAGKTSILDAISFALFNDYSSRGKKEHLINSRANKCRVGAAFTEGGVGYDVEWSMERKGSAHGSLFRVEQGKRSLLARDGERSVVPEIQKVLGIDKNMFLQSVYVRQGEIEKLVTSRPGERKELISRLLGVEDLEKAWAGIKIVAQEHIDRQLTLETELSRIPDVEKERKEYETRSKVLSESLVFKRRNLDEIDIDLKSIQSVLDQLETKKREFAKLDKQKGIIGISIEDLEKALERENDELARAVAAEAIVKRLGDDMNKLPFLDDYVRSLAEKEKQELRQRALQEKLNEIERLKKTLEKNSKNHELYLEKDGLIAAKTKERRQHEGADTAFSKARKQLADCEKEEKKRNASLLNELEKCSKALGEKINSDAVEAVLERKRKELLAMAERLEAEVDAGTGTIGVLSQRMKELDENLSKLSSQTEVKACPTCETELSTERLAQLTGRFSSEKEEAEMKLAGLQDSLKAARTERKHVEQRTKKIDVIDPDRVKSLAAELAEARDNVARQIAETEELEKQAEVLKELNGELEQLEGEKRLLEEASMEFESAKRQLGKMPSQLEIQDELVPIKADLEAALKILGRSLEKLGYRPTDPQEELRWLRRKKEEYDQKAPIAERRTEYESRAESTTKRLYDYRWELSEAIHSLEELGYDESEHERKKGESTSKLEARNNLKSEMALDEQARNGAEDDARKCRDELKTLGEKAVEKKLIDGFVALLNRIRDAYGKDGIQKMIRAGARPLLEQATRDLFQRFNLAYSDIKIDDDYNISVLGTSGEQDIDQVSGGERVALAIALRLAVAQVLSGKVETIIMDEPTTHLDEERRKELVNILNSFFREGGRIIPQMLIITHHSEIVDVADVVYTVRKEDGNSMVELESPTRNIA